MTLSSGEVKGEIILSYKFLKLVKSSDKKNGDHDESTKSTVVVARRKQVKKKPKSRMLKQIQGEVVAQIAGAASLAVLSAFNVENDPQGEVKDEDEADNVENDSQGEVK